MAAAVLGRAKELGTKALCWEVPHHVSDAVVAGLVEGTLLAAYTYREFKEPESGGIEALILSAHHELNPAAAVAGAEATNRARDLQNRPANVLTPSALAARASELAGVSVEVLDRAGLEAAGMGAFAAVARGTEEEPRLITISYAPADAVGPHPGLRGQGGDVRLRRHLDQARGEDARDEVRHVRRRRRAGGRRRDRRARPARARDRRGRRDREPARRAGDEAGRHRARQVRRVDRDQQHRRRGPARAGGLPHARDRPAVRSGWWTWRR